MQSSMNPMYDNKLHYIHTWDLDGAFDNSKQVYEDRPKQISNSN